ncbi:MAG TPA: BamA/TamA family outer membrane protein [Gemmatimonadales bacterium]|nr:BamA/TamA family outer membrane protein [Gemmatimonadales bacterium]
MIRAQGPLRLAAAGLAVALLALGPAGLSAQEESNGAPWKDSFYPFFPSLGNNFPLIALHLEERKAADYFARNPYAGLFSLDVGQGFTGARMAVARFHAPLLKKDWRLLTSLGSTRETRLGYFGLGNDTKDDESLVTKSQPHYYEARRTRYFGTLEISRRITGPLWIAGAGGVEHSNLGDLSDPSLFRSDFGTGDITDTDVRGRVTLVLDLRDNEFNTTRGLFAQASLGGGTGGDGYSRVTADVRGYIPLREGTVFAARVAGTGISTRAPLNARYEMPVWEGEIPVLGGTGSNRGLAFQRLAGKGALFANAELRHNLLDLGDFGAFTLFGFVDAGRVFEQEDFKLTTEDMKVGAGGGLAIRILRFTIWTFNFAGGPDGFQFSAGSGWSF